MYEVNCIHFCRRILCWKFLFFKHRYWLNIRLLVSLISLCCVSYRINLNLCTHSLFT